MADKVLQRRGLKKDLTSLSLAELGYTTDTRELFIGTGNGNVNVGGSHWYRGTEITGTDTAGNMYCYAACPEVKLDDIYMNTENGNIYACTTAGKGTTAKWTYQGCIKGPKGETGTPIDRKLIEAIAEIHNMDQYTDSSPGMTFNTAPIDSKKCVLLRNTSDSAKDSVCDNDIYMLRDVNGGIATLGERCIGIIKGPEDPAVDSYCVLLLSAGL